MFNDQRTHSIFFPEVKKCVRSLEGFVKQLNIQTQTCVFTYLSTIAEPSNDNYATPCHVTTGYKLCSFFCLWCQVNKMIPVSCSCMALILTLPCRNRIKGF